MRCEYCQKEYPVEDEKLVGKEINCPHCSIPSCCSTERVLIICPLCGKELEGELWMLGNHAECTYCGKEILLSRPPNPGDDYSNSYLPANYILGNYIIKRCVGKGGMGEVYEVVHKHLNRQSALKLLRPNHSGSIGDLSFESLIKEAQLACRFNSPNLIAVTDVQIDEKRNLGYIVMEYVNGKDLEEIISDRGELPEDEVLNIARGVALALTEAATYDVVHRDIKPANIMITDENVVKLADLGIAKSGPKRSSGTAKRMTGTVNYAAPEQLLSSDDVDCRADIYSLGATMYHLLSGRRPFEGNSVKFLVSKVLKGEYRPLNEAAPAVSKETCRLVKSMMSLDAADRPASAAKLLEEIDKIIKRRARKSFDIKQLWENKKLLTAAAAGAVVFFAVIIALICIPSKSSAQPSLTQLSQGNTAEKAGRAETAPALPREQVTFVPAAKDNSSEGAAPAEKTPEAVAKRAVPTPEVVTAPAEKTPEAVAKRAVPTPEVVTAPVEKEQKAEVQSSVPQTEEKAPEPAAESPAPVTVAETVKKAPEEHGGTAAPEESTETKPAPSGEKKSEAAAPEKNTAPETPPPAPRKPAPQTQSDKLPPFSLLHLALLLIWIYSGLKTMTYLDAQKQKTHPFVMQNRDYLNLACLAAGPIVFLVVLFQCKFGSKIKTTVKTPSNLPDILNNSGQKIFQGNSHPDSEAVTFLKQILAEALRINASDIFLDPKDNGLTSIRFRADGSLRTFKEVDSEFGNKIINVVKVAASMDIAERRRPQDGAFSITGPKGNISLRAASVGALSGEKIALRILGGDSGPKNLADAGIKGDDLISMEQAVRYPSGMVLICGPTGSGKTTTLYAMLNTIDYSIKNVVSIEDPIEHIVPAISQMEVNEPAGITFSQLLRNALRQNPDVICLGEIRDEDTASVAIHAAQTGHLIIATLHSNDNIGTIDRLASLNIPLRSIAGTLRLLVSQRLVRKLCSCKKHRAPTEAEQLNFQKFGLKCSKVFVPKGCSKCGNTGYSGRTALFDILSVDDDLRAALESEHTNLSNLRQQLERARTGNAMLRAGFALVAGGVTSMDEVQRVTIELKN